MKRAGNLYPLIAEPENLRLAFIKAIRGKRGKADVIAYTANLDRNLGLLRDQLLSRQPDVGHYHFFTVHDPKERIICAASFPERVLHHAIMNICEPVLERYAIHDSYACRQGKGMHAAVRRAQSFSRSHGWYLKLDIRKYFDSIDHEVVLDMLKRRIKDRDVLRLFGRILASYNAADSAYPVYPGNGCACCPSTRSGSVRTPRPTFAETVVPHSGIRGNGLPIGNLVSQHLANFYLGHLDHFVKETLRVAGYVRYMDDFILWSDEKAVLANHLSAIREFLHSQLHLELKANVQLNRCACGLPFLGYRVFANRLALGPRARVRFARKLRGYEQEWVSGDWSEADLARQMEALLSYVRFADSRSLLRQIVNRFSVAA